MRFSDHKAKLDTVIIIGIDRFYLNKTCISPKVLWLHGIIDSSFTFILYGGWQGVF